jgi:hypothetical protein
MQMSSSDAAWQQAASDIARMMERNDLTNGEVLTTFSFVMSAMIAAEAPQAEMSREEMLDDGLAIIREHVMTCLAASH